MPDAQQLISDYLDQRVTMQLASVRDGQPWICTVRFVSDAQHNLYWASIPTRRHSQEVEKCPQVACAIVVHDVIDEPVIGIQIEGIATLQKPSSSNRIIAEQYAARFNRSQQWVDDFVAGHTEHALYKLTPSNIYLFDEKHFPGGRKQKVHLPGHK